MPIAPLISYSNTQYTTGPATDTLGFNESNQTYILYSKDHFGNCCLRNHVLNPNKVSIMSISVIIASVSEIRQKWLRLRASLDAPGRVNLPACLSLDHSSNGIFVSTFIF